jgi:hypothetical protein
MKLDWASGDAEAFNTRNVTVGHDLHQRPLFTDEQLATLLDRYPRDRLGVFTMGDDPEAWETWRRGGAGGLDGAALLEQVKAGRLWLNLRGVNRVVGEYADLSDEIFAAVEADTGKRTLKRDVGLLISSPKAQVFYHLDVPLVMLWQLRGEKRVRLYPPSAPFFDEAQIERIVLGVAAEQFAYDPAWDAHCEVVDLKPGMMVSWPQNAPHRIENGDCLNLSLSIEFMTPQALVRANVLYANGLLRKALGGRPKASAGIGPATLAKLAIARGHKLLARRGGPGLVLPESFRLDERAA